LACAALMLPEPEASRKCLCRLLRQSLGFDSGLGIAPQGGLQLSQGLVQFSRNFIQLAQIPFERLAVAHIQQDVFFSLAVKLHIQGCFVQ